MLTQEHYEDMVNEIKLLYDRIDELIVLQRINDDTLKTYSEEEVLGDKLSNIPITIDEDDGWE